MHWTPFTTDSDGIVRGFPYHDGYFYAVSTSDHQYVELSICSVENERRVVALHGVVSMQLDGFRQGNIILNIILLSLLDSLHQKHIVDRLRDQLDLEPGKLAPGLSVLVLECSYGASLIAVCQRAEVSEVLSDKLQ